jgi:peptide/nickel transport system ATP-binding protein
VTACVRFHELRHELTVRRFAVAEADLGGAVDFDRQPIVAVENVSKTYPARGRRGHEVHAVNDVSLALYPGESVGLVGESGSGKTTLARVLVGLERAETGAVVVDGVDVTSRQPSPERLRHARRTIQIVFQDPYSSLNPARTIGATLGVAAGMAGEAASRRDLRARVAELLELVGLPAGYADRKPVALSGGERQRVAIARALAVRPRVVVCDEPVSALDVSVQAQILNLLQDLRVELGLTYLFITHDLAVVRQCADRAYVMYRGSIVEEAVVDSLLDSPSHPYTRQLVAAASLSGAEEVGTLRRAI